MSETKNDPMPQMCKRLRPNERRLDKSLPFVKELLSFKDIYHLYGVCKQWDLIINQSCQHLFIDLVLDGDNLTDAGVEHCFLRALDLTKKRGGIRSLTLKNANKVLGFNLRYLLRMQIPLIHLSIIDCTQITLTSLATIFHSPVDSSEVHVRSLVEIAANKFRQHYNTSNGTLSIEERKHLELEYLQLMTNWSIQTIEKMHFDGRSVRSLTFRTMRPAFEDRLQKDAINTFHDHGCNQINWFICSNCSNSCREENNAMCVGRHCQPKTGALCIRCAKGTATLGKVTECGAGCNRWLCETSCSPNPIQCSDHLCHQNVSCIDCANVSIISGGKSCGVPECERKYCLHHISCGAVVFCDICEDYHCSRYPKEVEYNHVHIGKSHLPTPARREGFEPHCRQCADGPHEYRPRCIDGRPENRPDDTMYFQFPNHVPDEIFTDNCCLEDKNDEDFHKLTCSICLDNFTCRTLHSRGEGGFSDYEPCNHCTINNDVMCIGCSYAPDANNAYMVPYGDSKNHVPCFNCGDEAGCKSCSRTCVGNLRIDHINPCGRYLCEGCAEEYSIEFPHCSECAEERPEDY